MNLNSLELHIALVWMGRLTAAAVAGAMIGLERELRGKPAGLRTIVLITMGSAMFMIGNEIIGAGIRIADPARIAAQIVSGVGFLGAGAILTSRNKVLGLTTAAVIWISAAIGIIIGYGHIIFGLFSASLTLFMLVFLTQLEKRFLHPWASRHGFKYYTNYYSPDKQTPTDAAGGYPQTNE